MEHSSVGPIEPDQWIRAFDQEMMGLAIRQAEQAEQADEVPVGAIITRSGKVIGAAHNQRETLKDATAHAEMIALTQAAQVVGDWRLEECTLYVTLEPCPMCAGAIVLARVPRVVFGARDPKGGAVVSLYEIFSDKRLNHRPEFVPDMRAEECGAMLTNFFRKKRALGKK